ncbi:MAG: c-type cytochrome biogenesis protein CcsB, partial [Desulfocapsaceae bacterium]|nr:c-type cytochrome biogenesis protein CcsB [Desulfocapsaceae bacterium]
MINEISFLLFQATLGITFLSTAGYLVFFITQNEKVRKLARYILVVSWGMQTLYIASRYYLAGHTPVTTHHEAFFFFAWATTAAYLSFRWRYSVKNFGTFVSLLILILLSVAAIAPKALIP